MAAVMGLGLLAAASAPAAAHGNKWGHKKHGKHKKDGRRYDSYRSRNCDDDYRYRNASYGRSDGRWRHYGNDIDGDGIPNDRDRDIDGDGHPNWRDDKPYGSGFDYSGGSRHRSRRRW
jgi:hypothetical protein